MEIASSAFTSLYLQLIIVVSFPIFVLILLKTKTKSSMVPFFIGGTIYVLFSVVGIGIIGFATIILGVSDPIDKSDIIYIIYQAVVVGLADETGRFVAFKVFMKGLDDRETPLFYAVGHAGFETLTFVAVPALSTIMFANEFSALGLDGMIAKYPEMQADAIIEKVNMLNDITVSWTCICLTERLICFFLHMALSVLIFYGVKNKRISYLWVCMILRAISTIPSSLTVRGLLSNDVVEVIILLVITLFICYPALNIYMNPNKEFDNILDAFKRPGKRREL